VLVEDRFTHRRGKHQRGADGRHGYRHNVHAECHADGSDHRTVTVALVKSTVPLLSCASTRIFASYSFPSGRPRLFHCEKCSEMEMWPHWRAVRARPRRYSSP